MPRRDQTERCREHVERRIEADRDEWEARIAAVRAAKIRCRREHGRPPLSSDLTAALGDTEGASRCYLRNAEMRTRADGRDRRRRRIKVYRIVLPRKRSSE